NVDNRARMTKHKSHVRILPSPLSGRGAGGEGDPDFRWTNDYFLRDSEVSASSLRPAASSKLNPAFTMIRPVLPDCSQSRFQYSSSLNSRRQRRYFKRLAAPSEFRIAGISPSCTLYS